MSRRTLARILLSVVLAALLAALSASAFAQTSAPAAASRSLASLTPLPGQGGTLQVAIGQPAYIDPYNVQESEGMQVVHALFKSLTRIDSLDESKVLPSAATSWTCDPSATVWTFHLDPTAVYSNGTSVTAGDFVYEWNRMARPDTHNTTDGKLDPSIVSYMLERVAGYNAVHAGAAPSMYGLMAVDDYTLRVTLTRPFADFPWLVAAPMLAPVPPAAVMNGVSYNGGTVPYGLMPIGNGDFKLDSPWDGAMGTLSLTRSDSATSTLLEHLVFRAYNGIDAAYADFRSGVIDFTMIAQGSVKTAKATYGVSADGYTAQPGQQVLLGAEDSAQFLYLNVKDKTLKNPYIRKAITLAVNRRGMSNALFEGVRIPATDIVPPKVAGRTAAPKTDSHYDVKAALAALKKSGHPKGKGLPKITIAYIGGSGYDSVSARVKADLAKVGIRATVKAYSFPGYLRALDAHKFQVATLGWVADYPAQQNFLGTLFASSSGDNHSGYSSAKTDQMLRDAETLTDESARFSAFRAIDARVEAANAVVPLLYYAHRHVASSDVHDLTYSPMGFIDFDRVWMTPTVL